MTTRGAPAALVCSHCGARHRSITDNDCLDRQMTEKTLQERVIGRAKRRKWVVAHAGKGWVGNEGAIVTPMSPGWPDLMLFKPGMPHPVIAMEFKREQGVVSEDQWKWLQLMNACAIPAVVIRPSDLREGRVTAILMGR